MNILNMYLIHLIYIRFLNTCEWLRIDLSISLTYLGIVSRKRFENTWNFPQCIGAIDGKHLRIECPKMTGTYYYNYKGFCSIVLLAICDSNYCFTLFDLGHYGSNNDSVVLVKSKIGEMIEAWELDIPPPSTYITYDFDPLPYFLVGDEIFPM